VRLVFVILFFGFSLFASDKVRFDFDALDLSPEQANEIKGMLKTYKHDSKQAHKRLHVLHEEKENLFLSERFDSAAYKKLEDEEDMVKKERIRLLETTHKILNARQREQFYKMYEAYERSGAW
jgi:Spy/CpxP family protein refolding chaperone